MDVTKQIHDGIATVQDYWFVVLLALVWFARNAIRSWIDSRLKMEVDARAKAVEAEVLTKIELLKASLSSDMEEFKVKVEVRKAVALELVQKRVSAFMHASKSVDQATNKVCAFLALDPPSRVGTMDPVAIIDSLHAWMERERDFDVLRTVALNSAISGFRGRLTEIVDAIRNGRTLDLGAGALRDEIMQRNAELQAQFRSALEALSN